MSSSQTEIQSNSGQGGGTRREAVARRALDIQAHLLRAMNGRGAEVADAMDWSESKLSRFKSGEQGGMTLEEICKFISALNLRLVSGADVGVDPAEIKALAVFAERGLRAMREELK